MTSSIGNNNIYDSNSAAKARQLAHQVQSEENVINDSPSGVNSSQLAHQVTSQENAWDGDGAGAALAGASSQVTFNADLSQQYDNMETGFNIQNQNQFITPPSVTAITDPESSTSITSKQRALRNVNGIV